MSKLPIFEHFLSVENLKPKLKWFFKPKLKTKLFLLNWVPVLSVEAAAPSRASNSSRASSASSMSWLESGVGTFAAASSVSEWK